MLALVEGDHYINFLFQMALDNNHQLCKHADLLIQQFHM